MNALAESAPTRTVLEVLDIVDTALGALDRRLPLHVSREDLASAGRAALVASFSQARGPLPEVRAYCFARVRGAMLDELRRLDPLSRRTRARVTAVRRAAAVDLSPAALRQALALGVAADSPDHGNDSLATVADVATRSPAESAESGDIVAMVQVALGQLPERHARVVQRYYFEEATLDEIAGELGVSIERVRQLRTAAEKRLREALVFFA